MEDTRKLIAEMTSGLDFERKPRVTKQEKEQYAALKGAVACVKKDIDKLNLRLWHACYKGDYRSLSMEQAKQELKRIRENIEEIENKEF